MNILKFELNKIFSFYPLWIFTVICAALNIALVFASSQKNEIDYINSVSEITGGVYSENYCDLLSSVMDSENTENGRYFCGEMKISGESAADIYKSWSFSEGAKRISEGVSDGSISKLSAVLLDMKYIRYIPTAEKLGKTGRSLSVYFASETGSIHNAVFNNLFRIFAAESIIGAVLLTLLCFGFEDIYNTQYVIYSSLCGRKIYFYKLISALISSAALFTLIFLIGYAGVFSVNNFASVWNTPVDSCNNFWETSSAHGKMLLWNETTVGGYFISSCFLMLVLLLLFVIMTASVYLFTKNIIASAGIITLPSVINLFLITSQKPAVKNLFWFFLRSTPAGLTLQKSRWFTFGDISTLFPHNEFVCAAFWTAVSALLLLTAKRYFKKSDIA